MTTPSPARGEMRLRVLACGICGSDLHWYQGSSEPPGVCPGHEVVGVVDALGDGVTSFEEGDRVALEGVRSCGRCTACRRGET